jgi:hypothetical protein
MRILATSRRLACWGACLLLLSLMGCVETYMPEVTNAPNSYLVVDGFINDNGATRIKLSRTENITTTTAPPAEAGATLYIVDNTGMRYSLRERSKGFYQSDSLLLNATKQYLLRITTASGSAKTYESELVPLKVTPPIGKLDWKVNGDQLAVQLSTQDANAQTRYYHWSVLETWEFHSAYQSFLEYRDGIIKNRITPIYTCWRTENSTTIRQASTVSLSQDALVDHDLLTFSSLAERVKIRYSVLVSQMAETAEEFAYREILRKNTEALGTVNDPLPSQLSGNVHCIDNAAEPVLGFVSAHTVQYKRLFISRAELPTHKDSEFESPYFICNLGEENLAEEHISYPNTVIFDTPDNVPVDKLGGSIPYGYSGSSRFCVNCRLRGTNVKPTFW